MSDFLLHVFDLHPSALAEWRVDAFSQLAPHRVRFRHLGRMQRYAPHSQLLSARPVVLPFRPMIVLFVLFILACGLTHFLDAIAFWWLACYLAALVRSYRHGCTSIDRLGWNGKLQPGVWPENRYVKVRNDTGYWWKGFKNMPPSH